MYSVNWGSVIIILRLSLALESRPLDPAESRRRSEEQEWRCFSHEIEPVHSPAGISRGLGLAEFRDIGRMIVEVLDGLARNGEAGNGKVEAKVKAEAEALCARFPIYG